MTSWLHTRIAVLFTCLVVAAFASGSCGGTPSVADNEAPDDDVEIDVVDRIALSEEALVSLNLVYETVSERMLTPSLEVPAELAPDPNHHATIGSRVAGHIVSVPVVIGDRVSRGSPLVVLESDDVGRARAELIAATARVNVARRAAERAQRLLADRVTSERTVDEAIGQLEIAEADLRAVQVRLSTFGVTPDDASAEQPAQLIVTSPISGTVVARSAHVGQWVEPSAMLIEIVNLDRLWLLASVYERDMQFVSAGQVVDVDVRAYPGRTFHGVIGQVEDALDTAVRSVGVRVEMANPDHRLKPGMFATARIRDTHAHDSRPLLAVPISAIQEIDGHLAVFINRGGGVFELRAVHTGERAGNYIEILNGLVAGAEVVTEGSFLLKGELLKATLGEEE